MCSRMCLARPAASSFAEPDCEYRVQAITIKAAAASAPPPAKPKFLNRVRLCSLGESLGGVETLISHPETMTHASVPSEQRQRLGITPGLVRISVGIEVVEDLIADLENAFEGI